MSWFDEFVEGISFSRKIDILRVTSVIAALIGIAFINKTQVDALRYVAIAVLSIITLLLVTAVLGGVIKKLEKASAEFRNELIEKIRKSINAERNARTIKTKLNPYYERALLYQQAGDMDIVKFRLSMVYAYIVLLLSIFISFFDFITPINFKDTYTNVVYWSLSSYHIVFILLIIGIYFNLRVVLYYNEMIRRS